MGNLDSNYIPVSIIVLSQNEEMNIGHCLKSLVPHFDDIWLIDSYSDDRTMEIAHKYNVNILQNKFIDYASQRNWALENANLKYDWIMYIDADEQVNADFCQELYQEISKSSADIGGMTIKVDFIFLGHQLRFARPPVPMLRVFRRGQARWETKGSREYGLVKGQIIPIKKRILHWNKKSISEWSIKQIKNATLEAQGSLSRKDSLKNENDNPQGVTRERFWRFWLRSKVWDRLPLFWRSIGYFFFRYLVRGGILDGKAGLAYCFLHALWFPLLIDIIIEERKHEANSPTDYT